NVIGFQRWTARTHARGLAAESIKEATLTHFAKLQRRSNVRFGHGLVIRSIARAGKQFNFIHLYGIVVGRISRKDSKPPVETLGTASTMGVNPGYIVAPCAAYRVPDKRSAAAINNRSDHIRFGLPNERIFDLD